MLTRAEQVIQEMAQSYRFLAVLGSLGLGASVMLSMAWIPRFRKRRALLLGVSCVLLLMTLLGIEGGARYAWLKAAANEYLVAVLTGDAQLKISPISTAVQRHDIQEFFSRPIPKIRQMEYGWQFADHHRFIVTFENQNTYMFSVGPYGEEKNLSSYYDPKYCIQDIVKWDEKK